MHRGGVYVCYGSASGSRTVKSRYAANDIFIQKKWMEWKEVGEGRMENINSSEGRTVYCIYVIYTKSDVNFILLW